MEGMREKCADGWVSCWVGKNNRHTNHFMSLVSTRCIQVLVMEG